MEEETVNEDIEKRQKVLKAQRKQQKQLIVWRKLLKVTKHIMACLQQGQIFENF